MRRLSSVFVACLVGVAFYGLPVQVDAKGDDQAEIKALEGRFVTAANAKDVDAIMKVYLGDDSLFVFDVIPPRQYVGAKAYRKDWEGFLGTLEGPITVELSDLDVTTGGGLAYGHS